jgi:hypothetical protein
MTSVKKLPMLRKLNNGILAQLAFARQGAKEDENLGKTWAKNRPRIWSKPGVEGCKSRRINNKLD